MNGISSVTDSPRPGQAHRVVTPEVIAAVVAIVKENRCVTVNEIAANLDMSHGSAHHIVYDVLHFHEVFSKLRDEKKKLTALSMLHKAKKAYYACSRVAARTGCAVHAPCLLAVRQLP